MSRAKQKRVLVNVTEAMHAEWQQAANAKDMSMSSLVVALLEQYLAKRKRDEAEARADR